MSKPNAKLTAQDVRDIHTLRGRGVKLAPLCRQFGISSTQLERILNGTQWKEVWLEFNDPEAFEKWKALKAGDIDVPEEKQKEYGDILLSFVDKGSSGSGSNT